MFGDMICERHKQLKVQCSLYVSPQEHLQQEMERRKQTVAEESQKAAALIQMLGQEGAEHAAHIASLKNRYGRTKRRDLKLTGCDKSLVHGLPELS